MATSLLSPQTPRPGVVACLGRGLLAVYLALIVAACGFLIINGSEIRAALEAERARASDTDDRAFCSSFDIGPETSRYQECVAGLRVIRARHDQRIADLFF